MARVEALVHVDHRRARRARTRRAPGRSLRPRDGPLGRRLRAGPHHRDRARRDPGAPRVDVEPVRGVGLDARSPRAPPRRAATRARRRGGVARAVRARVDPPRPAVGHAAGGAAADDRARRAAHLPRRARRADRDLAPAHEHVGPARSRRLRPRPLGASTAARRGRASGAGAGHDVRTRRAHLPRAAVLAGGDVPRRPNDWSPPTTSSRRPASPGSPRSRSRSAGSRAASSRARSATAAGDANRRSGGLRSTCSWGRRAPRRA